MFIPRKSQIYAEVHLIEVFYASDSILDVIRSFSPKTVLPGIKKQLTCSGMKSPEESLKPCLGRAEIEANVIKGKKKVCLISNN